MSNIRIFLADDHTLVRQGIRTILESQPGFEVVGEAGNGRDTLEKIRELKPDLVVLDIGMPELNGLDTTRLIRKEMPRIRILILTMHTHEEYIFQILKTGATGYLLKDAASSELITAVEAVYKGDAYLSPSISRSLLEDYVRKAEAMNQKESWEPLTEREREVLQLIAEGFTNRNIAEKLGVSVKTVDNHRTNLMVKLGIHDTAGLVRYAIAHGLVSIDEYKKM